MRKQILVSSGTKMFSREAIEWRRSDYGDGGILYSVFKASKVNYCPTIIEVGIIEEKKRLEVFKMQMEC